VGQFPGTGYEVGVDVGLGDMHESEILLPGSIEVLVYCPVGVDDNRFTAGGAPNEVARLRQLWIEQAPEDHRARFSA
jgi:hypothetical protein